MSHLISKHVSHHNISPINEAVRKGVWFVCFLFNAKKGEREQKKKKNPELLDKAAVVKIHK